MTTETILTQQKLLDICCQYAPNEDIDLARAIEQAVLQSHEIQELRKDALFGRVAIRFVDRAGDYCKEDPAEKICDEFNAAIRALIPKDPPCDTC